MSQRSLPWLICYDIRCRKRLQRLHRYMKKIAAPVQYSVFLIYCSTDQLDQLMDDIDQRFLGRDDDLRAYPVATANSVLQLGNPLCPEHWTGLTRLLTFCAPPHIPPFTTKSPEANPQPVDQGDFFDP